MLVFYYHYNFYNNTWLKTGCKINTEICINFLDRGTGKMSWVITNIHKF